MASWFRPDCCASPRQRGDPESANAAAQSTETVGLLGTDEPAAGACSARTAWLLSGVALLLGAGGLASYFYTREASMVSPQGVVASPGSTPAPWQCFELSAANEQEDRTWCGRAGSQGGFEYQLVAKKGGEEGEEAASLCGCDCCVRQLAVPAIKLASGAMVNGKLLESKFEPASAVVNAYFNIRFATAGRFEAPRAYESPSNEVIDGTKVNTKCIQGGSYKPDGSPSAWGSEDCLSLAVFTPTRPPNAEPRAVIVWIHGGGDTVGGVVDYVGSLNAMAMLGDVIVVAVQYRLGLFGYFAAPGNTSMPANRGLRDQIEGLRWVKHNVAAFGGDPDRVAIWGESAGARSVMALRASPLAKGLFQRAIADSPGFFISSYAVPTSQCGDTLGKACMQDAKCDDVECLLKMDAVELAAACRKYGNMGEFVPKNGVYFSGYDGEVLTKPLKAPLCDGSPIANGDVPLLVGTLANEWRLFRNVAPAAKVSGRFLWEFMKGFKDSKESEQQCALDHVTHKYYKHAECKLSEKSCNQVKPIDLMQMATDAYSIGAAFGLAPGARPYRWVLDIEAAQGAFGSCHTNDLAIIFGKKAESCGPVASESYRKTKKWRSLQPLLIDYWASFAKTGVPASPNGPTWPAVDGERDGTWGEPLLSLNLSSSVHTMTRGVFSHASQNFMADLVCGRLSMPEECAGGVAEHN